ncbi:MAG: [FeFe] hydrogenase H-cluster radical SAM maturase HydE [Solidesulfovibrio sp. DCME]|uniref:[FeFe] hydrogenase H-cluster radical SAM maturase HydE n=1 Tax=Solidesulfovibrio sp. DCME TaxID=3447380 RepID=UPI003D0D0651
MAGQRRWTRKELMALLDIRGRQARQELYDRADAVRREHHGDAVHLRGLVEFSNICANDCLYCGIRAGNAKVDRYRLDDEAILALARRMGQHGQTTIVLQSGEAPSPDGDAALGRLVSRIKAETRLAVTLSVGNRPREVYALWRDCGMDRYLLRFETSDPELFARLHPDCTLAERLRCLVDLLDLGVQTGGGFMTGLPGETLSTAADNILLCRDLDLDMIGLGPYLPHPDTPMGLSQNSHDQDPERHFVALAATRLVNPDAHIPATTAFDALFPGTGRNLALSRGANVFMPSATPVSRRADYQLYPGKPCLDESGEACARCVLGRLSALGRQVGQGPGHSRRFRPVAGHPAPSGGGLEGCAKNQTKSL